MIVGPDAFLCLETDLTVMKCKGKGAQSTLGKFLRAFADGTKVRSALRRTADGLTGTAEQRRIFGHRDFSDRLLPRRRLHAPRGALTYTRARTRVSDSDGDNPCTSPSRRLIAGIT